MSDSIYPLAPHHLPPFIPGPDGSDPLFTAVAGLTVILVPAVVGVPDLTMPVRSMAYAGVSNRGKIGVNNDDGNLNYPEGI